MLQQTEIEAICQSYAYALYINKPEANSDEWVHDRNLISAFWHALNRKTANRDVMIANGSVDNARDHTVSWLVFFRMAKSGMEPKEKPRWGQEYNVTGDR